MDGVTDPIRNSEGDMGSSINDVHTEGEGANPDETLVEVAWHLYCRWCKFQTGGVQNM